MSARAALCGFDLRTLPRARAVVAAALGGPQTPSPAPRALTGQALKAAAALGIWPLVFAAAPADPTPDDAAAWQRHRAAAATLRAVRLSLLSALDGLRWLSLKGDLMASALFGSSWARASADIDLLIAPDDLPACLSRLLARGYTPTHPFAPHGNNQLALLHPHLPLCVEVHWALDIPAWPQPPTPWLLDRATPSPDGTLQPDPLSLGLITALHFAHHQGALKPLTDLAAWWDRFGPSHGFALAALTRRLGLYTLTAWGALTTQRLSDLPCPGFDASTAPLPARALSAATAHLTRGCLTAPPDAPARLLLQLVKPEDHRWQTALLVASQVALSACLDAPHLRAQAAASLLLLGPHRLGRALSRARASLRPPLAWVAQTHALLQGHLAP